MKTTVNVNFTEFNTNKNNEMSLKLVIRGDLTDEQFLALRKIKAQSVGYIDIYSSQLEIDDINDIDEDDDDDNDLDDWRSGPKQLCMDNVIEIDYEIEDDAFEN